MLQASETGPQSAENTLGIGALLGQSASTLFELGVSIMQMAGRIEACESHVVPANSTTMAASSPKPPKPTKTALRAWAKSEYRRRRARADLFGGRMLHEPAWDILLDLFIAHLDGTTVRVNSACIAACVPATTGLRWLDHLTKQGLIARMPDDDARASLVALTMLGARKMTDHITAMVNLQRSSLCNDG